MQRFLGFRHKLLAAGLVAQVAATGSLTWNSIELTDRYLRAQLAENAVSAGHFLNAALFVPMMQRDYASVEAILAESMTRRGLALVIVRDSAGQLISRASPPGGARRVMRGEREFDYVGPISLGGTSTGSLQIALTGELVAEARDRAFLQSAVVGGMGLLLFSLMLAAASFGLTRPLEALAKAARRVRDGDYDLALPKAGADEIGDLARDFGLMVREVKNKVAEVERARRIADEANEAKSLFLAKMSHEIRTPLYGVLGTLELLADTPLQPSQKEQLALISRSGNALLSVVNDILDFTRIQSGPAVGESEAFDPAAAIDETVGLFRSLARAKGISLDVRTEQPPPRVIGDRTGLQRVLANLVGNAVKFTEQGGIVVTLRAFDTGGRFLFVVEDTGAGIAPEFLREIFDPFVQGDRSLRRRHGGTGLGLAIASELVASMGGRLSVTSTPGKGSVFYFDIPLEIVPSASKHGAVEPAPAAMAAVRPARLLVAEDTPAIQYVIRVTLEKLGHAVVLAEDGARAVERYCEGGFDAVLMDCHMPELDGYQAAAAIRAHELQRGAPRVPIIGVTASVMQDERARCIAAGMDDYLPKPFSQQELARMLSRWLGDVTRH